MVQTSGKRIRPLETVTPLAQSLGLTVDTSWGVMQSHFVEIFHNNPNTRVRSDRDDPDCVARAVAAFAATNSQSVLIC